MSPSISLYASLTPSEAKQRVAHDARRAGPDAAAGPVVANISNTPAQTHEAVGGTFARGGSSTPYGNLQEDAMSDQTDLIRGTLDC